MTRSTRRLWLALVVILAAAHTSHAQDKYKTYEEAYKAGAKFLNSGNLAAARGPLEAAFKLAFSGDGKRLAAATGDFAFVWDVGSGRELLKATHAASSETLIPARWIVDVRQQFLHQLPRRRPQPRDRRFGIE